MNFDPTNEYFAIDKHGDCMHYALYSIGKSENISVFRDGFTDPLEAKAFFHALPKRLYYYREHPPILVTMAELKELQRHRTPLTVM